MKRLWLILFVFPVFGQNPCLDDDYIRLKRLWDDDKIVMGSNSFKRYMKKMRDCNESKTMSPEEFAIKLKNERLAREAEIQRKFVQEQKIAREKAEREQKIAREQEIAKQRQLAEERVARDKRNARINSIIKFGLIFIASIISIIFSVLFIKQFSYYIKNYDKIKEEKLANKLKLLKERKLAKEKQEKEKQLAREKYEKEQELAKKKIEKDKQVESLSKNIIDTENNIGILERQSERRTWIFRIIFFNVIIFLLWQDGYKNWFNPSDLTYDLVMHSPKILNGEYWRLLTPAFLHGDIIHLGLNMFALYHLSEMCSFLYGKTKFLLSYLLFAFAGCFASFIWLLDGRTASLGASGAIFGVIGMLLGHYNNSSENSTIKIFDLKDLGQSAIGMFIYGFIIPGIDNAAHIGGFVVGYLLGSLYMSTIEQPCEIDVTDIELD